MSASNVYRVLIVDDDEDARVLLVRALGKCNLILEVETAGDGLQAMERVGRARPHAVITDVMMPRMNGFDLCATLRADPVTAGIPLIMVTALEDDRDRQRGLGSAPMIISPSRSTGASWRSDCATSWKPPTAAPRRFAERAALLP